MATSSSGEDQGHSDVFEIDDFTVVTALEAFQSRIEMILHDWGIARSFKENNRFVLEKSTVGIIEWGTKQESLFIGDSTFTLTYVFPKNIPRELDKPDSPVNDPMASFGHLTNASRLIMNPFLDFCPGSMVTNQFGVLEYLLIRPSGKTNDLSENQLNTVVSGATSALFNAQCELPLFVGYSGITRHMFNGIAQNRSMRTKFHTAHLHQFQPMHSHLAGLTGMFTEFVENHLSGKLDIRVSVMTECILQEKPGAFNEFAAGGLDLESDIPKSLLVGGTSCLPFGAVKDVLSEICLCGVWPNISADMIIENNVHSDLELMVAPFWAASATFHNGIPCAMHLTLKTLLDTLASDEGKQRLMRIVGAASESGPRSVQAALSVLAQPQTISITNPAGVVDESEGMSPDTIFRWIDVIFVRSDKEIPSGKFPVISPAQFNSLVSPIHGNKSKPGGAVKQCTQKPCSVGTTECDSEKEEQGEIKTEQLASDNRIDRSGIREKSLREKCSVYLRGFKGAPSDSLTCRISTALTHVLSLHESGTTALAQLWAAIVKELRNHWETNRLLPGLPKDALPDHGTCSLHQNLQMLQCCISSRIKQHSVLDKATSPGDNSDEEEFYDASQWFSDDNSSDVENGSSFNEAPEVPHHGEGRRRPLGFKLLNFPHVEAYEPWTQERCPMTEEMVKKLAEYLSSLDSHEARGRAQSDGLRSDMGAFKAANPGCCFEDFIRWYSENDITVDESSGKARLSTRMKLESVWKETFRQAVPRAASKQKRLFNESKEAEAILQELERLKVAGLIEFILPVVFVSAVKQLIEESDKYSQLMESKLIPLCQKVAYCTQEPCIESYLDILRDLLILETAVAQCNSLWTRFNLADDRLAESAQSAQEVREFVIQLVENSKRSPEVQALAGGNAGARFVVRVERGVNGAPGSALRKLFLLDARLSEDEINPTFLKSSGRLKDDAKKKNQALSGRMPPYSRRQYVFRCVTCRPGSGSRPVPHRMYAAISDGECRLSVSVSEDTVL